jgi:hypothetical protein
MLSRRLNIILLLVLVIAIAACGRPVRHALDAALIEAGLLLPNGGPRGPEGSDRVMPDNLAPESGEGFRGACPQVTRR